MSASPRSSGFLPFLCLGCVVVGLTVAPVSAANIAPSFSLAANAAPFHMGGSWLYDAGLTSGSVLNAPPPDGPGGTEYIIRSNEVWMSWTGNMLDTDLSTPQGWADAIFSGGGTFTLTGLIRSPVFPWSVVPGVTSSTVLLTGTVSDFQVRETDVNSNILHDVAGGVLSVTGGWLTGPDSDVKVTGDYSMHFNLPNVQDLYDGSDLVSFSQDLKTVTVTSQITFQYIPEPASALLLCAGFLMCGRRRQK